MIRAAEDAPHAAVPAQLSHAMEAPAYMETRYQAINIGANPAMAMTFGDSDFSNEQKAALQRIATLQRMREDATNGNRAAMLESIEKLLALEMKMLRGARDLDGEPA